MPWSDDEKGTCCPGAGDRKAGVPIENARSRSTLPGEQTWPTQPYPVKPRYAQRRLTAGAMTTSIESHAWALGAFAGCVPGHIPPADWIRQ